MVVVGFFFALQLTFCCAEMVIGIPAWYEVALPVVGYERCLTFLCGREDDFVVELLANMPSLEMIPRVMARDITSLGGGAGLGG